MKNLFRTLLIKSAYGFGFVKGFLSPSVWKEAWNEFKKERDQ